MKILVAAESRGAKLERQSLELLGAAVSLATPDDEIVALYVGPDAAAARDELGAAHRVVVAADPALALTLSETYARLLGDLMAGEAPDLVLTSYSANGLDVAGAVAARHNLPLVSYVIGVRRSGSGLALRSQIYGGKLLADTQIDGPTVLMLNPGAFEEAPASVAASIEVLDPAPALAAGRIQIVRVDQPNLADIDLSAAQRILCVGRGIGDAAGIAPAQELAALLGAELAGSRPVVDSGWLPKLRQVGKSGQKVKPRLYLALGVSGAPEHLEGMSRSELIIAINSDPRAPIFNVAHYGASCDLFDLIDTMVERLRALPVGR